MVDLADAGEAHTDNVRFHMLHYILAKSAEKRGSLG
jgi:hypothetical protein